MSDEHTTDEDSRTDYDHVSDVEAGAGCTEVWETLSEYRNTEE